VIPVGRLAIARFVDARLLAEVIGKQWTLELEGVGRVDVIPLPHPSGASTWFKKEPGKTLLGRALHMIGEHAAWEEIVISL
jgi:uracil-DNA glycosylase